MFIPIDNHYTLCSISGLGWFASSLLAIYSFMIFSFIYRFIYLFIYLFFCKNRFNQSILYFRARRTRLHGRRMTNNNKQQTPASAYKSWKPTRPRQGESVGVYIQGGAGRGAAGRGRAGQDYGWQQGSEVICSILGPGSDMPRYERLHFHVCNRSIPP